jgi:hypothetical protein
MACKRVAVFQAEWLLQSQAGNTVITLSESGYQVDLFLYKVNYQYLNF